MGFNVPTYNEWLRRKHEEEKALALLRRLRERSDQNQASAKKDQDQ